MGTMSNVYKISVTKHERKRPLGRFWHGWQGNIKMDLKLGERVQKGYDWFRIGSSGRYL
jgi:hypothetical protein